MKNYLKVNNPGTSREKDTKEAYIYREGNLSKG